MPNSEICDGWRGELRRVLEPLVRARVLTPTAAATLVAGAERREVRTEGVVDGVDRSVPAPRMIVHGVVRVAYESAHGQHRTIDVLGKGDFLCFPPDVAPHVRVIEHAGPVTLAVLPYDVWMHVIQELPAAWTARLVSWAWRTASRRRYERERLELLPSTRERLCQQLAFLAARFGRSLDDGWHRIDVVFPQELLGELISRTRSRVCHAFRELAGDRLVKLQDSLILVSSAVVGRATGH